MFSLLTCVKQDKLLKDRLGKTYPKDIENMKRTRRTPANLVEDLDFDLDEMKDKELGGAQFYARMEKIEETAKARRSFLLSESFKES